MKTKNASTQNQEKEILHDFAIWLNSDKGASLHWQSKDVSRIVTQYIKHNKQQTQDIKMKTVNLNKEQLRYMSNIKLSDEQIERLGKIIVKLSPFSTMQLWKTLGTGKQATHNISRLHSYGSVQGHIINCLMNPDHMSIQDKKIHNSLVELEKQVGIAGQ
jgi:7-keto-8-aminopelargonate synthetase-like enzyme